VLVGRSTRPPSPQTTDGDLIVLVLKRCKGEAIKVDGPAVVGIVKVTGRYVSVGIDAPESTNVSRVELPQPGKVDTQTRAGALIVAIQNHREAAQRAARELATLAGLEHYDEILPTHYDRLAEMVATHPASQVREILNAWRRESWQA
jgi:carbon storage regulator CsrA